MQDTVEWLPPYVSYKTWNKLLNALVTFTPDEITNSYYKDSQLLISSAKKMKPALHFLGLIDNRNVPTPMLHRLIRAHEGNSKETKAEVLDEILKRAYQSIFKDDFKLEHAAKDKLEDRFKILVAHRETRRHCITFFLNMAADAGHELSPHLAGRSRLGIGRKSIVQKSRERRRKLSTQQPKITQLETTEGFSFSKLHPAILALLKDLEDKGASWNEEEKDKFKKAFEAVFDIAYPDDRLGSK